MKAKQWIFVAAICAIAASSFAQKVAVGYDKSADFSKYKTYTWADPPMPPARPVLFETVCGRTEVELQAKGLTKLPKDGDLTLIPSGGIGFGFAGEASTPYSPTYAGPPPVLNATVWTGPTGTSSAGVYVTEGTFMLTFIDRATNTVVWSGSVKQNLDIEKKNKSLELANKAVTKLLDKYPPKKK